MTIRELLQMNLMDLPVIDAVFAIMFTLIFIVLVSVSVGVIKDIWRY